MTPRKLRLLADCLERDFIPEDERAAWVRDLRGQAKDIERALLRPAVVAMAEKIEADLLKQYRFRLRAAIESTDEEEGTYE